MKYNELINDLLNTLDENQDIKRLKELKKELLKDSLLLSKIKEYQLTKSLTLKKYLYNQELYLNYLKIETAINFLIQNIRQILVFSNRKCDNENNKW